MEKIAIISDVHGNLEALNTVLEDIKKRNVDKIFCLGDIIGKGVNPAECLRLIKEKCEVVVIGNVDRVFLDVYESGSKEIEEWNRDSITEDDIVYLKQLSYSYDFYLSGSLVRIYHSSPYIINDFTFSFDKLSKKYEMFLPSEKILSDKIADFVIYGHTHMQYLEKLYNKTLINVGSVGNSLNILRDDNKDSDVKETTRASYLILEGNYDSREYNDISYQFINLNYDINKELDTKKSNFDRDIYEKELLEGRYRNKKLIQDRLNQVE